MSSEIKQIIAYAVAILASFYVYDALNTVAGATPTKARKTKS